MPTLSSYARPPRVSPSSLVIHCYTRKIILSLSIQSRHDSVAHASREASAHVSKQPKQEMPTSSSYAGPPRDPNPNLVMHCYTRKVIPSLITYHKVQRSEQALREAHNAYSKRTKKRCAPVGVYAGPKTDPPHFRHTCLWKLPLQ